MRYAYHFEFCERPELPEWLRGDLFLSLAWTQNVFGLHQILESYAPRLVQESGAARVIELGSGSGDGLASLAAQLPASIEVIATDFFPHPALWRAKLARLPNASWVEQPVGFTDFDRVLGRERLQGSIVVLTAAFHHLRPELALGFLERCAAAQAQVLIIEPLPRTIFGALLGLLTGLPALLTPVFCAELTLRQRLRLALFHWIVPVIPILLSHDGFVSALRQRTVEDWQELIRKQPFHLEVCENLGLLRSFSVVLLKQWS